MTVNVQGLSRVSLHYAGEPSHVFDETLRAGHADLEGGLLRPTGGERQVGLAVSMRQPTAR